MKHILGIAFIALFSIKAFAQSPPPLEAFFTLSNYVGYNISCQGLSDGSITSLITGGVPPYTFSWSNSATTKDISLIPAGSYTLVVTDSLNNSEDWVVQIEEPSILDLTLFADEWAPGWNLLAYGRIDQGFVIPYVNGGNPPYTYLWSTGSTEEYLYDIGGGTYSLTITDANGCTASQNVTLTEPTQVEIVSITRNLKNGYDISCAGGSDGSITITPGGGVGPYGYLFQGIWREPIYPTITINNMSAGQHFIRVRDTLLGWTDTTITLTQPSALSFQISSDTFPNGLHVSCFDCFNGSITTADTGGVLPYSYLWSTGQTTSSINNLGPGDYNLELTDANGCKDIKFIELTGPQNNWTMSGNTGIDPDNQFVGTKDSTDFVFRTNNLERLRISSSGVLRISNLAGSSSRMLITDEDGRVIPGEPFVPNDLPTACYLLNTSPWYKANTVGPSGLHDIVNCQQRFGFGLILPLDRVHIVGFSRYSSDGGAINYLNIGHDGNSKINSYGAGELLINEGSSQNVKICTGTNSGDLIVGKNVKLAVNGGVVSIGTVTPTSGNYKLFVRGGIRTEAVKVDVAADNGWADYVFESNYKLKNIYEVEKFIKANKHLPEIPSSIEVLRDGIDLAEMNSKLLAKIEELTLYIIELNKKVDKIDSK